jgi:hypothetical protein
MKVKCGYRGLKKTGLGLQFERGCNFKKCIWIEMLVQASAKYFYTIPCGQWQT